MKIRTHRFGYIDTARPVPFQMRNARWLEGEGDDAGDDLGDDQDDTSDGEDGQDDDEGADELGDKGKQALARMKAKWKAERGRRIAAEAAAAEKVAGGEGGDIDREKVEREALAKANTRIIRSEIRAAAAGKLADPKDALNFIDPDEFEVDDDGNVDEDEIADAVDDLLAQKPYLAAQGGPRKPKPDLSQGENGAGTATTAQQFAAAVNKYI